MTILPVSSPASRAIARRRIIVRAGLKTIAALVVAFLLARVLGPELINLHRDWALVLAILAFLAALGAIVWLTLQLWADKAKLRDTDTRIG